VPDGLEPEADPTAADGAATTPQAANSETSRQGQGGISNDVPTSSSEPGGTPVGSRGTGQGSRGHGPGGESGDSCGQASEPADSDAPKKGAAASDAVERGFPNINADSAWQAADSRAPPAGEVADGRAPWGESADIRAATKADANGRAPAGVLADSGVRKGGAADGGVPKR
jgi:hypothetical protein